MPARVVTPCPVIKSVTLAGIERHASSVTVYVCNCSDGKVGHVSNKNGGKCSDPLGIDGSEACLVMEKAARCYQVRPPD